MIQYAYVITAVVFLALLAWILIIMTLDSEDSGEEDYCEDIHKYRSQINSLFDDCADSCNNQDTYYYSNNDSQDYNSENSSSSDYSGGD